MADLDRLLSAAAPLIADPPIEPTTLRALERRARRRQARRRGVAGPGAVVVLVLALGALGGRGRDDRGLRTASEPEGNAVPVAAASAIPAPRPLAKDEADVIVFLEPAVTPAQVDGVRARLGDVCRVWPGSSRSCAPQHQ